MTVKVVVHLIQEYENIRWQSLVQFLSFRALTHPFPSNQRTATFSPTYSMFVLNVHNMLCLVYNEISMRCEKIEDESIPLLLKFRLKDDHFSPFHRTTHAVFVAA